MFNFQLNDDAGTIHIPDLSSVKIIAGAKMKVQLGYSSIY